MKTQARKARVLVVDDDPSLLELIEMRLAADGYAVTCAASGAEALERFRTERPRVVISDLRMEGMDGHALFSQLHAEAPTLPVIMLTAHGTIPDAVVATQRGVFGFLTKPFDGRELLAKVADAMRLSPPLEATEGEEGRWLDGIVAASTAMNEVLRQARRAADSDDPVLLSGPRGSGKETLARALHAAGPRAAMPFAAIRCGHEHASALAGALAAKSGFVFLDDVEELSLAEQAQLLPLVMERGPFSPRAESGSVGIVAATAKSLDQAIRDKRFRADLFYALGRVALSLPSLAERRADIPLLVAHFVAQTHGLQRGFSPEAMAALQEAAWPGNVRQLRNVVEGALAKSVTAQVPATLVRELLREEREREIAAFNEARRAFEYDYLVHLLETTGGNVSRAARVAQRNRTEFYQLLARHSIDPGAFK